MLEVVQLIEKHDFTKDELVYLLELRGENQTLLFKKAASVKEQHVGKKTYFRGLIEFSNLCQKNCLYCGIRAENTHANRYTLHSESILEAVDFAYKNKYASIVLQSGERHDKKFIDFIDNLLIQIKERYNGELGITLSVGEQNREVYQKWFDLGANRYLLRIEASNKELYEKLHPLDGKHSYERRLACLQYLKEIGSQNGTGVMIGSPFQKTEDLADDLLFFKEFDVDMIGMGPYIEHEETPLFKYSHELKPLKERFLTALNMIAILRIMMPDINIAAATALQAIDPIGREKALQIGANVIMPNITPSVNKKDYLLYQNKPCIDEGAEECLDCLVARVDMIGDSIAWGEFGNSLHYVKKNS
jgi:biotin synthase